MMNMMNRSPLLRRIIAVMAPNSFQARKAWDKERFFDQNAWTRGSPPGIEIRSYRLE